MSGLFAKIRAAAVFASALLLCPIALAAPGRTREGTITERVTFDGAGLRTDEIRDETLLQTQAAVAALRNYRITNDDQAAELVILEAATIKPGGRRIDVPLSDVSSAPGVKRNASGSNDAVTKYTVQFANLEVGDRRIIRTRRREKTSPLIPGVIQFLKVFLPVRDAAAFDITIDVPDRLHLYVEERDLQHTETAIEGGHRLNWHFAPVAAQPEEPLAAAPIDTARHIFLSNFADWTTFGRNYAEHLAGSMEPDPTVKAVASGTSGILKDRRAIATALFDWVCGNTRYVDVALGTSGWIPRKPAVVLAQRTGDSKDLAGVLHAMLAAKGIDSELALINTHRTFAGRSFPAPFFDHAILYVPEFQVYLDPSDPTSTFEELPLQLRDKPVLRIAAAGGIYTRTPLNGADSHLTFESNVRLDPNGFVTGQSRVEGDGAFAVSLRREARVIATKGGTEVARSVLAAQNTPGTGILQAPSHLDHRPSFQITATFRYDKPLFGPGARAEALPTGPRIFYRPGLFLLKGLEDNWSRTFACGVPGVYLEKVNLDWPASLSLARVPRDVDVQAGILSYKAKYAVQGTRLSVERSLRYSPLNSYCDPAVLDQTATALRVAQADVFVRLMFERSEAAAPPPAPTLAAPPPQAPAGAPIDDGCGAPAVESLTLKGLCTQLSAAGKDLTGTCSGSVSLATMSSGKMNVCFTTSENAVIGFSGSKASQVSTAPTTTDQPVKTVGVRFANGIDNLPATGDCIIDDPGQGSPMITCSANTASGAFQATFVADAPARK